MAGAAERSVKAEGATRAEVRPPDVSAASSIETLAGTPEPGNGETRLRTAQGATSHELEERRIALRRMVFIGGAIAWPLFVVTDFIDASITGHPEILVPLLSIRGAGMVIAAILLRILKSLRLSPRMLAACDIPCFASFSFLVSLEAVLLGGFQLQVVLGIMILSFMRTSLL